MDDDFISEKIAAYLDNDLTPKEAGDFGKLMKADQELRDEVALFRNVIEAMKADAFKKMLNKIHLKNISRIH